MQRGACPKKELCLNVLRCHLYAIQSTCPFLDLFYGTETGELKKITYENIIARRQGSRNGAILRFMSVSCKVLDRWTLWNTIPKGCRRCVRHWILRDWSNPVQSELRPYVLQDLGLFSIQDARKHITEIQSRMTDDVNGCTKSLVALYHWQVLGIVTESRD